MKTLIIILSCLALISANVDAPTVEGAWSYQDKKGQTTVVILSDGHYSITTYDLQQKLFGTTLGGKYRVDGDKIIETIEFNTANPELVGTERSSITMATKGKDGALTYGGEKYKRLDDGTPGKLAGAWVITGRMTPNGIRRNTPGARRTMKILSGTRFQWIAYNVETKEFSGTGGGTYTTVDGKYTENIEFFSRDNSRVGASLSFEFAIEGTEWRHKGLSSKGDPLDEMWTKRSEIGL